MAGKIQLIYPLFQNSFFHMIFFSHKILFLNKILANSKTYTQIFQSSPVYSLNLADAIKCLNEIRRVGKGKSFITLGAYEFEKDL